MIKALLERQAVDVDLHGTVRRLFVCPLCLGVDTDPIPGSGPHNLSREDAPQVFTGHGEIRCLTHAACNNNAQYETHAANAHRLRTTNSFTSTNGEIRITTLGPTPERMTFHGTTTLGLTPSIAEVTADLKSAYLIAFAILGYHYIATEALGAVRAIIKHGLSSTNGNICGNLPHIPEDKGILFTASEPFPIALVRADWSPHGGDQHYVFLPPPTSPPNFYEVLKPIDITAIRQIDGFEKPAPGQLPRLCDQGRLPLAVSLATAP